MSSGRRDLVVVLCLVCALVACLLVTDVWRIAITGHVARSVLPLPAGSIIAKSTDKHAADTPRNAAAAAAELALAAARAAYRSSHNSRAPPALFDDWYRFAASRECRIENDFYSPIDSDFATFRAAANRTRSTALPGTVVDTISAEMVNGAASLSRVAVLRIRNGTALASVEHSRAWIDFLQPILDSSPTFRASLDLVLNTLDEPRVLRPTDTPYVMAEPVRAPTPFAAARPIQKKHKPKPKPNSKPPSVAPGAATNAGGRRLLAVPPPPQPSRVHRLRSSLDESGSPASIRAGSDSRRRDYFASAAAAVRSSRISAVRPVSKLLSTHCRNGLNDTQYEHGFFLGPATFDVTDVLVPVFSQTKIDNCFADIVIPTKYTLNGSWRRSPGDAVNPEPNPARVRSVPPLDFDALNARHEWSGKLPVVYWRGSPTGGVPAFSPAAHLGGKSTGGGDDSICRRMHRQRAVAALRALNGQAIAGSQFRFQTDACFIKPKPGSSGGGGSRRECTDLTPYGGGCDRVPFEDHWKYKYLIDIDGNSFSRRYKSFLYSNSLVFKVTLFPEYFESSLRPWVHYIPVRTDLSDLSAAVAWAVTHDAEAKLIAQRATVFARHYLRAVDEQCWMYRAIMEYTALLAPNAWTANTKRGLVVPPNTRH